MEFNFIDSQSQLQQLCAGLTPSLMALDTEFVRTRTFYANLGLLQLAQDGQFHLIDPLAVGDLTPFWQQLSVKTSLWHSFGEDLEIVLNHKGNLEGEYLDTQVACGFLNMGHSLGYAAMVAQLTGVVLDKGESRTDWLARPLQPAQLDYAIKDVVYLEQCYNQLAEKLAIKGMTEFFKQECQNLVQKRLQKVQPDEIYIDLKNASKLSRRSLAIFKLLASWRYQTAKSRNYALNFVVKEAHLWEIAKHAPTTKAQLSAIGVTDQEIRIHGNALLQLVKQGLAVANDDCPSKIKPIIEYPAYKKEFKRIKDAVTLAATTYDLPVELIASKKTIHQYLSWLWKLSDAQKETAEKPMLLSSWRFELMAKHLGE
ncbi:ribonuclease D [Motilimonas cestriensis]|uniref:Ribonuclease D n=1 Tax=Motilimonas cestriensis TaxID=2742685 RepID=A0ABS8WBI6_9GAMM|nr:ribonuclease D [Motilimonas cestriensis]MCE2594956.1 ribonuclease D [Motilimonas cestriensis]